MTLYAHPFILRLCGVPGFEGRKNDVVYCRPLKKAAYPGLVIFFGGDVQDFTENMQNHRDNKNYTCWNLENTAQVLQRKFAESHILIIRPSRMELKTFSCYENFVPCNNCGVPEHTPMNNGLSHLEKLLCNISERLQTMTDIEIGESMDISRKALVFEGTDSFPSNQTEDFWIRTDIELENCNLKILGFSKGCVVLNQFLYEFHYFSTLKSDNYNLEKIIGKIKDMYWLDGGHSGGKNTWINSKPLLETLTGLDINIHVHVTPYQIQDDRRPWIKKEEKMFSDTLRRLGSVISRTVHFENVPPSLLQHFDVLNVFGNL